MTKCRCLSHNGFLTERGYAELAQRNSLEGLAPLGGTEYVDSRVSVSALVEGEDVFDHELLDQQYRRFLNGS